MFKSLFIEHALSTLGKVYSLHLTPNKNISLNSNSASSTNPFCTYPDSNEDQETTSGSKLSSTSLRAYLKRQHLE
ncbi:hypothetical protein VIGAN_10001900 [Vigna angularis var. angularis]|uniref:Uncharacterized protein n=1 Tax=Vigna angularis var. angularis TaxID=157739 RepID=A0A0S3T0W3_PHAAN|nr:hypothetical protein VIGAN_10001900 [Vigna angularis var. angularis]